MIRRFVTRPLFTLSLYLIFLLIGYFSFSRLPLDFLPNISIPTLTIITPYPGAGPEDIETSVSKVIEDAVATVPNIDRITSDSAENISTVTIAFKWGTDLDPASADVRDKMDLVRGRLPSDVEPSTIFKFDLSQIPVLVFGVSADESYSSLYQLADKKISPALKRIGGVGTINILGGLIRQININIDRGRLEAYHLSINQVNLALQAANLSVPAGSIKSGALEYGIRVPGEFNNIDEIRRTIVGSYNGGDIYLSDIALVGDGFKEQDNMTEVDGKAGVMIQVQKQSGANTVDVVKSIRRELAKLMPELPPDVKITYVQDTSESIVRQINELTHTLYWSFFFVVLTVLFFLRDFRGSFIVSLAIPISILAAFIYMAASGATINIISLASIIISIGVVVDDAIVVLENFYRHLDKKHEPPREAAVFGTGEVAGAVIASTATNLVIFIPLLLVQGFIAIFFNQLSAISIVVMAMSLVTAMSLTPMLCSKMIRIEEKKDKSGFWRKLHDQSEIIFERIDAGYKDILAWALGNRRRVLASLSIFFILSMGLFALTGSEFFPEQDSGLITATVEMPAGSRWDQTAGVMRQLAERIRKNVPETEFVMVSAGSTAGRMSLSTKNGANYGRLYLKVVPLDQRRRDIKQLQRAIAELAYAIPGLKGIDFAASGANSLAGGGKPVTLEIYGSDFEKIDLVADQLKSRLAKVPGVVDPTLSREKAIPEYALKVDRQKASSLGLSMYDVAMTARAYLYGTTVSKYRIGGDQYDIFVQLKENDRRSLDDIKNVFITTRTGKNISLGNIVKVELRSGPQVIQRKNQQRIVKVEADYFGRSLGDITGDIREILAGTSLPDDITVKIAGNSEQIAESFRSLFVALLLAIALIYLVMVAQFESFLMPFIIMFSIPFALAGVVWALFLSGISFSVMAFIGLILVTGVAVKNAIVLIDFTNILRARGLELKDAIKEAGRSRLRPILMTSITTILGLMPIVLSGGEGSGFWKPMAVTVIGGLVVSVTVTLVFVPTLYYTIENWFARRQTGGKQE
ncbi:MAG: efflux RND transporter permease subunit [Candidatus Margulisbacteria bacterium]|nr:efflux RND transporter permease subunit [Candidatus Margulisiibacteriota bacterium]MBU1616321.1 efflux RND transporter permease subunit [Candidatus Margulisiibacteriota bacterium]